MRLRCRRWSHVHLGEDEVVASKGRKEKTKGCRHEAYEAPKIIINIISASREIIGRPSGMASKGEWCCRM